MVYIFGTMLFAVFLLGVIAFWLRRKGLGGGAEEKWAQELERWHRARADRLNSRRKASLVVGVGWGNIPFILFSLLEYIIICFFCYYTIERSLLHSRQRQWPGTCWDNPKSRKGQNKSQYWTQLYNMRVKRGRWACLQACKNVWSWKYCNS